jgi:hypothetical protein
VLKTRLSVGKDGPMNRKQKRQAKKETKGERAVKYFKDQLKLTLTMLDDSFALMEERKCVIHLCDEFFDDAEGCDAQYIKGSEKCKGCGAEIPEKYRCLDRIHKLQL